MLECCGGPCPPSEGICGKAVGILGECGSHRGQETDLRPEWAADEECPASDRCCLKLGPSGKAGAWEWSVCYTGGLGALRAVELKGEGVV